MKAIKNEQDFAALCLALKQNNSEPMGRVWLQFYPANMTLDDTHCIRFGQALIHNTTLEKVLLGFPPNRHYARRFTTHGLQALAHGIRHSQLTKLEFRGEC
jgi:hypothetical protein